MSRLPGMKSAGLLLTLSLAVVACGGLSVDDSEMSVASSLPLETINELSEECRRGAEAITGADPTATVEMIEDIGVLTASSPEGEELRDVLDDIEEMIGGGGGDTLNEDQLVAMAPMIAKMSSRLAALGADECSALEQALSVHLPAEVTDDQKIRAGVDRHRELWRAAGVSTYHFLIAPHMESVIDDGTESPCGLGGRVLVQVENGEPELAVDKDRGCEVDTAAAPEIGLPLTVEDLFDLIMVNADALLVEVAYEASLGHPETVFIQGNGKDWEIWIQELTPGRIDQAGHETVLAKNTENRSRWEAQEIRDYTLTVQVVCFCPPEFRGPITVTVENGEVDDATFEGNSMEEERYLSYFTVEGLFDYVEQNAYADTIQVTYHPELGYPQVIDVDPLHNAVDDETRISIVHLAP